MFYILHVASVMN